jgi:hypothetical protein
VTVATDTYRRRASGRWMVRDIRVAKPGQPGVYGPDLVDRWKGRAFQQSPDSTISLVGFEDEQVNWEANSALLAAPPPPLCATGPVSGCRQPVRPRKAALVLLDRSPEIRDQLRWRWRAGPVTPQSDYGDPFETSTYQLCVYDAAGRTIAGVAAPPGGDCGGRPCWRRSGARIKYRSRDRAPDGSPRSSFKLTLSSGATDGKASIIARARGVQLNLAPPPAQQPLRVQIKNSEGLCWESDFSAPASVNRSDRFSDKSD